MLDINEALSSMTFYVLCGVGYAAFAVMFIVLKGMNQTEIMPWWVKLMVLIAIPAIAVVFSGYAEGG